jgi:hypothetical protein
LARPVQLINAKLAVNVTYPGDETAVESIQEVGGNLFLALCLCRWRNMHLHKITILTSIPILAGTVLGDVVLFLMIVIIATFLYFLGFHAPLQRSLGNRQDDDM